MGEKIQNNLNNILTVIFYDFIEFYSARKVDQYIKKPQQLYSIMVYCTISILSGHRVLSRCEARSPVNLFLPNLQLFPAQLEYNFLLGKFGNSSYIQRAEGSQMSYCDLTFFTQGKCFLIVHFNFLCDKIF